MSEYLTDDEALARFALMGGEIEHWGSPTGRVVDTRGTCFTMKGALYAIGWQVSPAQVARRGIEFLEARQISRNFGCKRG